MDSSADLKEQRTRGRAALFGGLAFSGLGIGLVMLASVLRWESVMLPGSTLFIGWIVFGFGLKESVLGDRVPILGLLLALTFGIFGAAFSFWAITELGFDLRK